MENLDQDTLDILMSVMNTVNEALAKRDGWRNKESFLRLYDGPDVTARGRFSAPISTSSDEAIVCTNPTCNNVQSRNGRKFGKCPLCFTMYCSRECQVVDWKAHKDRFCKTKEAYMSRLKYFEEHLPHEVKVACQRGDLRGYCEHWEVWAASKSMIELAKWIDINIEDYRPTLENIRPQKSDK